MGVLFAILADRLNITEGVVKALAVVLVLAVLAIGFAVWRASLVESGREEIRRANDAATSEQIKEGLDSDDETNALDRDALCRSLGGGVLCGGPDQ